MASVTTVLLIAGALVGGCGGDRDTQGSRATSAPVTTQTKPGPSKLYAGKLGSLPPPDKARRGPALVLPKDPLTVPGSFPLGSVVAFEVPVRNDGTRPLRILELEPG